LHPAYAHAVRVCGFMVTEMNQHLMTAEMIDEWEAALESYFEEHPEAPPLD
jgi:hypothetical protein